MSGNTIYRNVKIPIALLEEIDKIVANQTNGYRSRNEACVDAVRRFSNTFRSGGGNEKKH